MGRRFFEDVLIATRSRTSTRFSVPVSVAVHAAGITGLVALSLANTGPLPTPRLSEVLPPTIAVIRADREPPSSPRHDPRPPRPRGGSSLAARRPFVVPNPDVVPTLDKLPDDLELPEPTVDAPVTGPFGHGFGPGTDPGSVIDGPAGEGPGPTTPARPVMLVREPKKLRHVEPVYPEMARRARVEGVVEIECLITPEGRVSDVRVVSGHPLLVRGAVEAVQQWIYTPTVVNGRPLAAILTVRVKFHLVR